MENYVNTCNGAWKTAIIIALQIVRSLHHLLKFRLVHFLLTIFLIRFLLYYLLRVQAPVELEPI